MLWVKTWLKPVSSEKGGKSKKKQKRRGRMNEQTNEWIETSFIQNEWKAYLKNNNIRKSDKAP